MQEATLWGACHSSRFQAQLHMHVLNPSCTKSNSACQWDTPLPYPWLYASLKVILNSEKQWCAWKHQHWDTLFPWISFYLHLPNGGSLPRFEKVSWSVRFTGSLGWFMFRKSVWTESSVTNSRMVTLLVTWVVSQNSFLGIPLSLFLNPFKERHHNFCCRV